MLTFKDVLLLLQNQKVAAVGKGHEVNKRTLALDVTIQDRCWLDRRDRLSI